MTQPPRTIKLDDDQSSPPSGDFAFNRQPVLRWVIQQVLLTIVTLGVYRFWFITNLRKRIWSSSQLNDTTLRYQGTGKELLIGFLIAIVFILPFLIGISVSSLFFGLKSVFISVGLVFIVVMVLMPYAVFRRQRYILTRTSWRGIRFHMQGSPWQYVKISIICNLASILTLGLAVPWAFARKDRLLREASWFGDKQFQYSARTGHYWGAFKPAVVAIMAVVFGMLLAYLGQDRDAMFLIGASMVFLLFCAPWIQARLFRLRTNSTRLGNMKLSSNFGAGTIYLVWFVSLLILSAVGIIADQFLEIDPFTGTIVNLDPVSAILVVTTYFFGLLFINAFFYQYFILAAKVESLSISESHELENIRAAGDLESSVGAGLVDVFDSGLDAI